jgi:glucosamine kinase
MSDGLGLGIDAGGTQTRWALARASGEIVANGSVAGLTALQMNSANGAERIGETLADLARAMQAYGQPQRVYAGLTGFSEGGDSLRALLAEQLGVEANAVTLASDIEIACLDLYAPGEGYVVYAGTGSIAAFIDAAGTLHRAGGRGVLLDDAGGGFWIAKEALRHIWRQEDERPDSWRESPMAREIFKSIGGSDWAHTRHFVYGTANENSRGEIGKLAIAVAAVADADPVARRILEAAGAELARLARAMVSRFGPRPVTLTGRAAQLHPVIFDAMCAALPEAIPLQMKISEAHVAAARIAAKRAHTERH